jgi:hypothetical protein
MSLEWTGLKNMYRVIAIIGGALTLAACAGGSDLGDLFKSAPTMDTVRFESEPPGADAKASNGQSCKTPCALALPTEGPLTVTFTLAGYQTATENIEMVTNTGAPPSLRPNPVVVELTAAPPAPPAKKPARKRPAAAAKKPAPKPAAGAAPAAAPPPAAGQQGTSPWPATPAR